MDEFDTPTVELAECAKINLEQMDKFIPGLARHPIYMLALAQLRAVCDRLKAE